MAEIKYVIIFVTLWFTVLIKSLFPRQEECVIKSTVTNETDQKAIVFSYMNGELMEAENIVAENSSEEKIKFKYLLCCEVRLLFSLYLMIIFRYLFFNREDDDVEPKMEVPVKPIPVAKMVIITQAFLNYF